ncbi:MAG: hypothetical protein JRJ62_15435, partial [Deltaproteobacteria bacterium]|nr:hypothetical protein [Deltaproteobacteria bacterium]
MDEDKKIKEQLREKRKGLSGGVVKLRSRTEKPKTKGAPESASLLRQKKDLFRHSAKELQLIMEYASDGINIAEFDIKTHKRRLILCNDRYVEMAGRSRKELMAADDLNDFVRHHYTEEEVRQFREKMRQGIQWSGQAS